ncbi:MAG TPA: hypothetical protein ENI23_06405 [bacterium]|nr:hypothetical protein [bacterium]
MKFKDLKNTKGEALLPEKMEVVEHLYGSVQNIENIGYNKAHAKIAELDLPLKQILEVAKKRGEIVVDIDLIVALIATIAKKDVHKFYKDMIVIESVRDLAQALTLDIIKVKEGK